MSGKPKDDKGLPPGMVRATELSDDPVSSEEEEQGRKRSAEAAGVIQNSPPEPPAVTTLAVAVTPGKPSIKPKPNIFAKNQLVKPPYTPPEEEAMNTKNKQVAECIVVIPKTSNLPHNVSADGIKFLCGFIVVILNYAGKYLKDVMKTSIQYNIKKKNFIKNTGMCPRSVEARQADGELCGDLVEVDNKKRKMFFEKAAAVQLVDDEDVLTDENCRGFVNETFGPAILDMAGSSLYSSQVPKLRDGQDVRTVEHWSDACDIDSIDYLIKTAHSMGLKRWLKENPAHVYLIWPKGKVPVEEFYGSLQEDCLHPEDKINYDGHTEALKAFDEETEPPAVPIPTAAETAAKNVLGDKTNEGDNNQDGGDGGENNS